MKVEQKGHTVTIKDTQGDLVSFLMKKKISSFYYYFPLLIFKEGCLTIVGGVVVCVEFVLKGLQKPLTTPSKFDFVRILSPLLEKRRGNYSLYKTSVNKQKQNEQY